jgi:hypothetical protein
MPAPRPDNSLSTRSKLSTHQPVRLRTRPVKSPLIEPPTTRARLFREFAKRYRLKLFVGRLLSYIGGELAVEETHGS